MADDSIIWWTVPQAAVWIRTRDQHAADHGLSPREARSLVLADGAVPGAFSARRCLRAALERGRFNAYGRAARLAMASDTGEVHHWILDEHAEIIPQAFWQRGGDFEDGLDEDGVRAVVRDESERWVRVVVDRDDCIGHWAAPRSMLADGAVPLGHLIEDKALQAGPEDNWAWFLGHADVTVTGLRDNGQRVTIDRQALATAPVTIDSAGSLSLGDFRWSCVIVEPTVYPRTQAPPPPPKVRGRSLIGIASPVEQPAEQPSEDASDDAAPVSYPVVTAPVGRPGGLKERCAAHIASIHPNGTNLPTRVLVELLAAAKIYASPATVERAIGRRAWSTKSVKTRQAK
jgi:hypothetical protein